MTVRTNYDMAGGESEVGYSAVIVKRPGAGSVKHEFLIPAPAGTFTSGAWKATTNVFARPNTSSSLGIVTNGGAWAFPYSPNPNFDYERGLPFRKSEFNEAGTLVRKTETTYQYIYKSGSTANKVWGLKYERYPGCSPSNKIYFHGKYFLLTDVQKVPSKEKITTYDITDVTGATRLTDSTEYFYESANHKLLTQVKHYTSDGKIYSTRIKYPKDYTYTLTGATDATSISYLIVYGRAGTPIEQIQTLKKAADSTEYVIGGSVVKLSDMGFGQSKQLVRSTWKLKTNPAIAYSSFNNSQVVNSSGYKFKIDSRYERTDSLLSYTSTGDVKAARNPFSRQTSVTGYGYSSTLPVVQLVNAPEGTASFSDFETTTKLSFSFTGTAYYGTGRTGKNAFYPSVVLRDTLTKADVNNYLLSFWIKNNASVSFNLVLKDAGATTTYSTTTFSVDTVGSSSKFKYVQKVIALPSNLPSTFRVEFNATGLSTPGGSSPSLVPVVDDVFFYPENADMVATTYNIPFGPASVTSGNGNTVFSEYDKLGRLRYVYDRDRNIVKRNTYNYTVENPLVADFHISEPYSATVGISTTFVAADNACLTGLTYEWNWGSGYSSGSASQAHTFTSPGSYNVSLKVISPSNGTKTITKVINVEYQPLQVGICAKGVHEFTGTSVTSSYSCSSITAALPTSYGFIAKVTPTNAESGETFSYRWVKRDIAASSWVPVGSNIDQYTFNKVVPATPSFVVKCEVTSSLGRVATTAAMEVIVTP